MYVPPWELRNESNTPNSSLYAKIEWRNQGPLLCLNPSSKQGVGEMNVMDFMCLNLFWRDFSCARDGSSPAEAGVRGATRWGMLPREHTAPASCQSGLRGLRSVPIHFHQYLGARAEAESHERQLRRDLTSPAGSMLSLKLSQFWEHDTKTSNLATKKPSCMPGCVSKRAGSRSREVSLL